MKHYKILLTHLAAYFNSCIRMHINGSPWTPESRSCKSHAFHSAALSFSSLKTAFTEEIKQYHTKLLK